MNTISSQKSTFCTTIPTVNLDFLRYVPRMRSSSSVDVLIVSGCMLVVAILRLLHPDQPGIRDSQDSHTNEDNHRGRRSLANALRPDQELLCVDRDRHLSLIHISEPT